MFGSFIYCPCSFFIWLFFIQSSICRLSCGIRAKRISWKFHKARGDPYHTEFNSYWANNFYFVFHMRGGRLLCFVLDSKRFNIKTSFWNNIFFDSKFFQEPKLFFRTQIFFRPKMFLNALYFQTKNFLDQIFFCPNFFGSGDFDVI